MQQFLRAGPAINMMRLRNATLFRTGIPKTMSISVPVAIKADSWERTLLVFYR
jgi:hypothetical protein